MVNIRPPEISPLPIECPECHQIIEVPLKLAFDGIDDTGNLIIEIDGDYADLWLHVWTHQEEPSD